MDREGFLETIRRQYAEDIHEAYLECEHEDGRTIDYPKLTASLMKLMRNAKVDGLPQKDFEELVRTTLPQVDGKVDFGGAPMKKAA